jgi:hypothetical protein
LQRLQHRERRGLLVTTGADSARIGADLGVLPAAMAVTLPHPGGAETCGRIGRPVWRQGGGAGGEVVVVGGAGGVCAERLLGARLSLLRSLAAAHETASLAPRRAPPLIAQCLACAGNPLIVHGLGLRSAVQPAVRAASRGLSVASPDLKAARFPSGRLRAYTRWPTSYNVPHLFNNTCPSNRMNHAQPNA